MQTQEFQDVLDVENEIEQEMFMSNLFSNSSGSYDDRDGGDGGNFPPPPEGDPDYKDPDSKA